VEVCPTRCVVVTVVSFVGVGKAMKALAEMRRVAQFWNRTRLSRGGFVVGGVRVMLHAPHDVAKRLVDSASHYGRWHCDLKDARTGADITKRYVVRIWKEFKR